MEFINAGLVLLPYKNGNVEKLEKKMRETGLNENMPLVHERSYQDIDLVIADEEMLLREGASLSGKLKNAHANRYIHTLKHTHARTNFT